jgi:spore maturation protein CgeB
MRSLRILYVAMKYDYGYRERGYSFEHYNFYESLARMGHEVIYFDFKTLHSEVGHEKTNRRLWETVRAEEPELMFCFLYEEELERRIIQRISEETSTVTLNWFADDHWRFETFSRYWAPCFNWVVTTAQTAVPKYAAIGYDRVIKSQWGFNHFLYRKLDLPLAYDVTFVGNPHGNRRQIVEGIRRRGVDLKVWGAGWEMGRIEQEAMIRVFNQSRINLNLSNASNTGTASPLVRPLARARSLAGQAARRFGPARRIRALVRSLLEARAATAVYPEQIKARNFEIPGCAGFQLSGPAENIEDYFIPGKEIVCYNDFGDLVEKIRYYLAHTDEREAVAEAGYQRAKREHSYERRLTEIFDILGLGSGRPLAGNGTGKSSD